MIRQNLTIIEDSDLQKFTLINFLRSGRVNISDFYKDVLERKSIMYYMELVVKITGVTVEEMRSKSRNRHIVTARKMFFVACYRLTKESTTFIGAFANKDHATVIHAVNTLGNDYYYDFRESYRFVKTWVNLLANNLSTPPSELLRKADRFTNRVLALDYPLGSKSHN